MTKIHSLQNTLAVNSNQELQVVLPLFEEALQEFEGLEMLAKRSNVRNLLFCIFQISNNKNTDTKLLEQLAKTTKNLKQFTYESEYYSKVNALLYKKMFVLSGDSKREILLKKNCKVEVETGLLLVTSLDTSTLESLEDGFLTSLNDQIIVIETGGDGIVNIEIELVDLHYPFLSLADYKKEILNCSDLITINLKDKVFINDGANQSPKNIIELQLGQYNCVWYQFETKYKLIIVKK
jgi:hypothetical protein